MTEPKEYLTEDYKKRWELNRVDFQIAIGLMEMDGDFGPEWADHARKVLGDMDDFVLSED